MQNNTGLVVLSGGQDSITCLGVALKGHKEVQAISFNYGQQHAVELDCAITVCERHNVPLKVVDIRFFKDVVTSSLTGEGSVNDRHQDNGELPASFVPNRNAMFLTIAHAYAQKIHAGYIYTGVCETDYSGYPDCRQEFIHLIQATLNSGSEQNLQIVTPLMKMNKAQIFELADSLGFLDEIIEHSHTCYEGNHHDLYQWGYGCGECAACKLRKKGYEDFVG